MFPRADQHGIFLLSLPHSSNALRHFRRLKQMLPVPEDQGVRVLEDHSIRVLRAL
jgi:hypothetical protein